MKAITLWQPWASLMAGGYKKNETRSWSTGYRGDLVIHAAKALNKESYEACKHPYIRLALLGMGLSDPANWPVGKILCVVTLNGCLSTNAIKVETPEFYYGDYSPERFAWVTNHLRRLKTPIACSGHQQLWNLRPDIEDMVRQQLRELERLDEDRSHAEFPCGPTR